VQLVLLGIGSIIGDMSLTQTSQGARRSATVVVLTPVVTMLITIARFVRVVPPHVLESLRIAAEQKERLTQKHLQEHRSDVVCCCEC
jgi:CRP-like cAMP-binding protein